ncbi:MAG: 50S ribosomal protein L32 [Elusimicrobia bacterium]|nr:50S ribosomal protein L32 [Elusimicrobiota bacterium]
MPNPKKKHTRHRTGIRRASNWRVEPVAAVPCPNCKGMKLPHRVCGKCGFYGGRLVITPKMEKSKKGEQGGQQ